MCILLTGFGPFRNITDNPSQRLCEWFDGREFGGGRVISHVLTVSYDWVSRYLPSLLIKESPDAVVMLGVASGTREHLRFEAVARNECDPGTPDVYGQVNGDGSILSCERDVLTTTAPIQRVLRALRHAGLPVRLSANAGRYVCNYAYFTALHTLRESGRMVPCVFVHVPEANPLFPMDRQISAVEIVLTALREG